MKAKIIKVGTVAKHEAAYTLDGWEFACPGVPSDYSEGDVFGYTYAELQKISTDNLTLAKLREELRRAADKCPNCQGAREYPFLYRGRENIVPCIRCEPIYKLLEPLEVALEILTEA